MQNEDSYALSVTDTLRFIRLYKQERLLWDPDHSEYLMRVKRRQAVERITKRMGLPNLQPRHIKQKIKSYRDMYTRETKKQLSTGAKGPYWLKEMSFLNRSKNDQESSSQNDEEESLFMHETQCIDSNSCDGTKGSIYDITIKEEKSYDDEMNGINDCDETKFYRATTSSTQNTSNDTATLKSMRKLIEAIKNDQKTVLNMLNEKKEDSKEDFCDKIGNYLATLMRMLPKSKVYALQPKLIAIITSELEKFAANEEHNVTKCSGLNMNTLAETFPSTSTSQEPQCEPPVKPLTVKIENDGETMTVKDETGDYADEGEITFEASHIHDPIAVNDDFMRPPDSYDTIGKYLHSNTSNTDEECGSLQNCRTASQDY